MHRLPSKLNRLGQVIAIKPQRVKRKGFKASYPGECVALDTMEKRIDGKNTSSADLYSRFAFAFMVKPHTARESLSLLEKVKRLFPFNIRAVLTDNGSEFKGIFDQQIKQHWHSYVKTPKMNAHL